MGWWLGGLVGCFRFVCRSIRFLRLLAFSWFGGWASACHPLKANALAGDLRAAQFCFFRGAPLFGSVFVEVRTRLVDSLGAK